MKLMDAIGMITVLIVAMVSCQSDESIEFARYYSAGRVVYQHHCQNCHGSSGEGLQGLIPPLTDTVFLKNNLGNLSCLLKNGQNGKLIISKRNFEGQMPPTGLAPIEIGNVLTYVANTFGNKLGTINVDRVTVDLRKCE